jgi:hypothetical protein
MTSQELTVKIDHLERIIEAYSVDKPLTGLTLHFSHPNNSIHWIFNNEQKEISEIIPLVLQKLEDEKEHLNSLLPAILEQEASEEAIRLEHEAIAEAERIAQEQLAAEQQKQAEWDALILKQKQILLAQEEAKKLIDAEKEEPIEPLSK